MAGTGIKMAELSIAQVAIYAFPLIFAVVCARNLGPANYGVVAFYTALTSFLCMFIEFGFDSIGVREVHAMSRREDPEQVMWNVTLAKLIVCLLTCIVAVPVLLATRSSAEASMSYAMLIYMVAFALDTSWYLRSLELMRSVMFVAAASRLAGIVLLVCVVTGHDDVGAAMWTYAFVAWANAIVGWLLMRQSLGLGKPRLEVPHLKSLFRSGAAIVVGNLSGASLTSGGIAVLGVLADPVLTGAANMALRIKTAGQAVMLPLSQLGFVRLSTLVGYDPTAAVALGRRLFYALMAISLTVALLIIINADLIAALAYGLPKAPEPAGVLVRLLAVGIPASVAGNLFGLQCLTLFKQERAYVLVLLAAAAIFFGLLLFSDASNSPNYGWAFLTAESWVFLAAGLHLRRVVRAS
ncbi:oligosaccharide flippase family protein [Caenimonas soli]|uniref:oligosaccharide flippase family protein n=1 Tax=Caenimonas soli TaxID=2735555 RepID=UPI001555F86C|nr:oligosaccharide flippase family protein [Caenimonas soli]NPC57474.1 oligosaccharide flippase family protein [Caenimonas soli]